MPFLTGDQPIVNVNEDYDSTGKQRELELYYPLTPKLAMLYTRASSPLSSLSEAVDETQVRLYNRRIVENSYQQVYSNSAESLGEWRDFSAAME